MKIAIFSFLAVVSHAAYDCTMPDYQEIDDGLFLRNVMNPEDKTVTIELAYNGFTWLGIGRSKKGWMVGSEAVIGRVDIENSGTNPGKYYMSGESGDGVNLVDNQSLMNATIKVDRKGNTVLKFTKYLEESGEFSISQDSGDIWVYAVGSTSGDGSYPTYHDMDGSFTMPLTPCKWVDDPTPAPTDFPPTAAPTTAPPVKEDNNSTSSSNTGGNSTSSSNTGGNATTGGAKNTTGGKTTTNDGAGGEDANDEQSNGNSETDDDSQVPESGDGVTSSGITSFETGADKVQTLWVAHGCLMAIAWGVLIPMAIGCSILRNPLTSYLGKGTWYTLHRAFNLLGFLLTFISFVIALAAVKKAEDQNFDNQHKKVGLIVVLFMVVQVFFALIKPTRTHVHNDAPPSFTSVDKLAAPECPPDTLEYNEEDEAAEVSYTPRNDTDTYEQIAVAPNTSQKSLIRKLWEVKHRAMGLVLIGLAWLNCHTGINIMEEDYSKQYGLKGVFWGFAVGIAGIIVFISYVLRI